jgi:hypothetical protein
MLHLYLRCHLYTFHLYTLSMVNSFISIIVVEFWKQNFILTPVQNFGTIGQSISRRKYSSKPFPGSERSHESWSAALLCLWESRRSSGLKASSFPFLWGYTLQLDAACTMTLESSNGSKRQIWQKSWRMMALVGFRPEGDKICVEEEYYYIISATSAD